MALLLAVKVGIFVVQAVGNTGPSPKCMSSFSPLTFIVSAASHNRMYANSIFLWNNVTIPGVELASGIGELSTLISAVHALNNDKTFINDMYVGECILICIGLILVFMLPSLFSSLFDAQSGV